MAAEEEITLMRGDGRVFRRGRTFWIAYYAPGPSGNTVEMRESSGSENEPAALKLLKQRLREVANHRTGVRSFAGPKAERLTVAHLLDSLKADYQRRGIKSFRRTMNHARPVREFFGHFRAVAVTPDLIRKYIEERKAEGRSNAKVNRETEILSAAFRLALKEDRIARVPHIPHLSEQGNARKGFFEPAEHELMLKHLRKPLDDMARFAYVSGWRASEIRLLKWENVDRSAREVTIYDSKNGEGRVLPLDDDTWTLFERLWGERQYQTKNGPALSEFVFHRAGKPVAEARFTKDWQKARAKAGAAVRGKLFHDYRRTAARNMIRAGVPQAVAMKITGHKTDSMFRRYNIVSGEDRREAMKAQREYLKEPVASNVSPFDGRS